MRTKFWTKNFKGRDDSDNIRMDFRERGWVGMDRMHLAEDRDHWGS